jgi:hypothetical protein
MLAKFGFRAGAMDTLETTRQRHFGSGFHKRPLERAFEDRPSE